MPGTISLLPYYIGIHRDIAQMPAQRQYLAFVMVFVGYYMCEEFKRRFKPGASVYCYRNGLEHGLFIGFNKCVHRFVNFTKERFNFIYGIFSIVRGKIHFPFQGILHDPELIGIGSMDESVPDAAPATK
jgi:hypothetical protein